MHITKLVFIVYMLQLLFFFFFEARNLKSWINKRLTVRIQSSDSQHYNKIVQILITELVYMLQNLILLWKIVNFLIPLSPLEQSNKALYLQLPLLIGFGFRLGIMDRRVLSLVGFTLGWHWRRRLLLCTDHARGGRRVTDISTAITRPIIPTHLRKIILHRSYSSTFWLKLQTFMQNLKFYVKLLCVGCLTRTLAWLCKSIFLQFSTV